MTKFLEKRSENRPVEKDIVVIYHGNCSDGFGAAWAAWKKFGDSAQYFGVDYHSNPPKSLAGKEVYLLDFTYPKNLTEKMIEQNKKVTAIDHHISAKDVVKMTKNYVYGIDNSGAILAWKYFHPKKSAPKLLKYIEDQDLWKFKLRYSKEINQMLDLFDFKFSIWDGIAADLENNEIFNEYAKNGRLLLKYEQKTVERVINSNAQLVLFEGHKIFAVNAPHFLASQIGHALYKKRPPMSVVWGESSDSLGFSLRSDGSVDVSEIAKKYGGGGHRAAAGFSLPLNSKLPWKKIN